MIPKDTKICISTKPLTMAGGVTNEVNLLCDFLYKNGYKPKVMFSSNIKKNLFFNEKFEPYNKEILNNIITTKSYIPFLWPHYHLYGNIMKKHTKNFDIFHQIGGSCFEATPFYKARKKYICWVATTFKDEWKRTFNPRDFSRPASWLLGQINTLSIPMLIKLEKKLYNAAERIFFTCHYAKEMIKKECDLPEEKLEVLANPTDTDFFSKDGKNKINFKDDYLLTVCRLDKRKGLDYLLVAFKDILKKFPNLKLYMVGNGPEKENLKQLAKDLGIAKSVEFKGFVNTEDLPDYYRQAKIFILSSLQEGLAITILEALSCGTPIVSTNCGGTEDINVPEINDRIVPIKNSEKLKDAILEQLEDENLRKRIANLGYKKVLQSFSVKYVGKRFLEEYEKLVR